VLGSANLFLINPNGIVFGAGARLDLGGSFVGTTADGVGFGDRGVFGALSPEVPSLLLTVQPSAFLFNQISTQPTNSIESRASLAVPDGHSLLLVGGQVSPNTNSTGNILITREGESERRLRAPGGRIEIGGLAAPGTIGLNIIGNDLSLHFPTGVPRIDVFLTGSAELDVTSGNRGDIGIYARNIHVRGGSDICAGVGATSTCGSQATAFGSFGSRAGDINLDAQETVFIADPVSSIENAVNVGAIGNGGGINIQAKSLIVRDGGEILASTNGQGNAGNINIYASDFVAVTGQQTGAISGIYNSTDARSNNGNGGRITINTPYLSVIDNARLLTYTSSIGIANELIIQTDRLLIEGSQVGSTTFDLGNAGNVIIRASNSIELRGEIAPQQGKDFGLPGGLFSQIDVNLEQAELDNLGTKGGRIFLETNYLSISDGSRISVSTFGTGNAGDLLIRASAIDIFNTPGTDRFFPTGIFSGVLQSVDSQQLPRGNGGNIRIETDRLSISHDGQVDASTEGLGDAGNIRIQARLLSMENNGLIRGSTSGRGNAGDILIQAHNMQLNDTSTVVSGVQPGGTGRGGNINIQTRLLSLTQGSQIGATVFRAVRNTPGGRGQGGNIRVSASDSIMLSGINNNGFSSGIVALTERGASGQGGNIFVDTGNLRVTNGAVVGASTFNSSSGGTIVINARNLEALNGGQILTSTRNTGNAGVIRLNITDNLTLSGVDSNYGERLERARQLLQASRHIENGKNGIEDIGDIVITEGAASGLLANTVSSGNGGSINVNTQNLTITDRARISARSQGRGIAGNIAINASDSIASNNGTIETRSNNSSSGNVAIAARTVQLQGNSDIRTQVNRGEGSGGNIALTADSIVAFDDSDIVTRAPEGQGGNITFNTPAFFGDGYQPDTPEIRNDNDRVDVDASGVQSGIVTTPDVSFIQNSLAHLSDNATNPETLLANSCIVRDRQQGRFTITGSGGLPERPGNATQADYPTGTIQSVTESESRASRPWQMGDAIVEPQGVYRLSDGRLVMGRECEAQ
jgi:large exoprotein involved in heme utilization and adhesion